MKKSEPKTEPNPIIRSWHTLLFLIALVAVTAAVHFHESWQFRRNLIDFDDATLIAPLKGMTLKQYFFEWSADPNHYAFALRDMTYFFDFKLSEALGWNTFWLSNYVLFILVLIVLLLIFRLYLGPIRWTSEALIALIALHPLQVEIIHWASNRKHLLVALFVAIGTYHVLKISKNKIRPKIADWMIVLGCYIAGWLCWPSMTLWILWVFYVLRTELKTDQFRWLWLSVGTLIMVILTYKNFSSRESYAGGVEAFSSVNRVTRFFVFGVESLGRAAWSIVSPFQLAAYYRVHNIVNWIGFILLTLFSWVFYLRIKKISKAEIARAGEKSLSYIQKTEVKKVENERRSNKDTILNLLYLVLALFTPQGAVFLTYGEFVWADRYLFVSLPYIVLMAALLFMAPQLKKYVLVVIIIISTVFAVISYKSIDRWETDLKLFNECAFNERSPKCVFLSIEKHFDKTACVGLGDLFKVSHELVSESKLPYDDTFNMEVPLYEALCVVGEKAFSPFEKQRRLAELKKIYHNPFFVVFGDVILYLQNREYQMAYNLADEKFFRSQATIQAMPKVINLLRGLGEALCAVAQLIQLDQKDCNVALEEFNKKTQNTPRNEKQIQWGMQRAIDAVNGN